MKIIQEISLKDFDFWSGAKSNAQKLTNEDMKYLEDVLEEMFSDHLTETELNDLFWFEFETVCEWIGKNYCIECDEIECNCHKDEE